MYTIGQVAEMFHLPISTLRYYDKEGLFPGLERKAGIRRFTEQELEALRVIECLKKAGLGPMFKLIFFGWIPTLIITTYFADFALFIPRLLGYVS